mmetsp:Transcript_60011/g.170047  ORF Transcript_60011/g.170047 Transcript_60011/m.170047 type:complete len:165 (+) Transcript_60011:82-576(+)
MEASPVAAAAGMDAAAVRRGDFGVGGRPCPKPLRLRQRSSAEGGQSACRGMRPLLALCLCAAAPLQCGFAPQFGQAPARPHGSAPPAERRAAPSAALARLPRGATGGFRSSRAVGRSARGGGEEPGHQSGPLEKLGGAVDRGLGAIGAGLKSLLGMDKDKDKDN